MTRSSVETLVQYQSRFLATLAFGAALALIPLSAMAQTAAPAAPTPAAPAADAAATPAEPQATASVKSADGADHGTVALADTASGALYVTLKLTGVPEGTKAVHIHEVGKCEGPKFESAGGHLAGGKSHGAMSPEGMHSGDMPNIEVAAGGQVDQEFFLPGVKVADVMDADGGAFVVHADADDYVSQPAGNAGDRIACGVFEAAKPAN